MSVNTREVPGIVEKGQTREQICEQEVVPRGGIKPPTP